MGQYDYRLKKYKVLFEKMLGIYGKEETEQFQKEFNEIELGTDNPESETKNIPENTFETFAAGRGESLAPENQEVIKTKNSETFASEAVKTKDITENDNAVMSAYTGANGVPLTREQVSAMTRAERKKILEDLSGKDLSRYGSAEMFQMENDYLQRVNSLYKE